MSAILVAGVVFVCCFGCALLGLVLRDRLPKHHLESESRDAVKLVMGLVATMSALVLGLLVSTTEAAYRGQSDDLALLAADVVSLDRVLLHYGQEQPDVQAARGLLRQGVQAEVARILVGESIKAEHLAPEGPANALEPFYRALHQLQPETDAQRESLARAIELTVAIARTRMLMSEQQVSSLPIPFLGVLIFWLAVLFLGFGLMTRLNPTVVTAMLVGALSVSCALFLILELDHPFTGLMRISSAPLRVAVRALDLP